jgi:steroid 5-alpha reductase family enzyme
MIAALLTALAITLPTWLVSLRLRDASIVDVVWSWLFIAITVRAALPSPSPRAWLVLALVTLWGVRLSLHLLLRARGRGEDSRYADMRRQHGARFWWVSLFTVFGLQALLAAIISLPLQAAAASTGPLGWLDLLGTVVFAAGFTLETVADAQLQRWKRPGRVMDRGLWRLSRHPNYFGEALLFFGLGLVGLAAGAWWSLAGPLVLLLLLLRVSGVTLMESTIGRRRPGYADYVRRTSAFIPWPPARAGSGSDPTSRAAP